MRKPIFCICKNKGIDHNCTADQCFCFHYIYIVQFLYFHNLKFQASSHLMWLYSPVCISLIENPKDRFSGDMAHFPIKKYVLETNRIAFYGD